MSPALSQRIAQSWEFGRVISFECSDHKGEKQVSKNYQSIIKNEAPLEVD